MSKNAEFLRQHWNDFCDADPVPENFADDMEAAGLITLRAVTKRDVEDDCFAYERGIELGGSVWVLTDEGRTALAQARKG